MEPVEQTGLQSVVFRAGRGENQRECLPTAYKPQLITRRSLVQVQPPQPNKKGTPDFPGCFCFRNYDGKNDLPHSDPVFRRTPENCSPQGRFPHKRPLPCCEKGGPNGESAPLRLLTQKPMKPWFHRFFFLPGIASDPYSDPVAERSGAIQKAPDRTFPITSAACRWAAVVTWA